MIGVSVADEINGQLNIQIYNSVQLLLAVHL
jgi:hypothetical protein